MAEALATYGPAAIYFLRECMSWILIRYEVGSTRKHRLSTPHPMYHVPICPNLPQSAPIFSSSKPSDESRTSSSRPKKALPPYFGSNKPLSSSTNHQQPRHAREQFPPPLTILKATLYISHSGSRSSFPFSFSKSPGRQRFRRHKAFFSPLFAAALLFRPSHLDPSHYTYSSTFDFKPRRPRLID